jgi:parallel beta-helix repeat protein
MNRNSVLLVTMIIMVLACAQFMEFSSANFFPAPGPDLPRIYLRSNGEVEPATAPIEKAGNTYKLKENISLYTIEIQLDNIVLDGSGHLITGNVSWLGYGTGNNGIIITGRNNVTLTHLNIAQCYAGIRISGSSNINVVDNSFVKGTHMGIVVQDSTFVLIEGNTFTNLTTDLNVQSVSLNGSKNTVRNNTFTDSSYGIGIEGSSNVVSDNTIQVALPIQLDIADSNIITRNTLGPGNEGIALFRNCSNNIVFANNINGFVNQAIRIMDGSNNTIYGNNFAKDQFAISLGGMGHPENNTFYANNFAADSCNVRIDDASGTFWDNGTIGNHWGNYAGKDGNGDGIGDSPYNVIGHKWDNNVHGDVSFVGGQDNYPLMSPYDFEHGAVVLPQTQPFVIVLAATAALVIVLTGLAIWRYRRKQSKDGQLGSRCQPKQKLTCA